MEIIRTKSFDKDWKRIGATEADFDDLSAVLANPEAGDLIKGLHGLRKVRFALKSRNVGKSGGGRAIYMLVTEAAIVLVLAYAKNEQSDLSSAQRKALLKLVEQW